MTTLPPACAETGIVIVRTIPRSARADFALELIANLFFLLDAVFFYFSAMSYPTQFDEVNSLDLPRCLQSALRPRISDGRLIYGWVMRKILCSLLLASYAVSTNAETKVPNSQTEISLGFAPVVKQASPAVVNIYAKIVRQGRANPFFSDPFFQDFFGGGLAEPRARGAD